MLRKPFLDYEFIPYLNVSSLVIDEEVPYEETLVLTLHKPIMAFSRTSCSTARSTNRRLPLAYKRSPARTLRLFKIEKCPVTCIKVFIEIVSGWFHVRKDIESPIYSMMLVHMVVCTDIAHACIACQAHLESFHVWVLLLIVYLAVRNVLCNRLLNMMMMMMVMVTMTMLFMYSFRLLYWWHRWCLVDIIKSSLDCPRILK
jgi:hypothetical protein